MEQNSTEQRVGIRYCLFGAVALLLAVGQGVAQESLDTIVIDAGYDTQTKIAVVPFRRSPELAGKDPIDEIVAFDLARSGQFAPVERRHMLSFPH